MKRLSLRSITASRSRSTAPPTWLRRPCSAASGRARMPARPARSASETVSRSLPRHEAMPMPVMAMRRLISEVLGGSEQAHAEVLGGVDLAAVLRHAGVALVDHQLAVDHAADVDLVGDLGGGRQHLAEELHLAAAQGAAATGRAQPGEVEANQLPHGVQAQAAGHHRITDEVALEEPQVRVDVEFGADEALAVLAAVIVDLDDAVEHQHRVGGEAGVAGGEEFTAAAGFQLLAGERRSAVHAGSGEEST